MPRHERLTYTISMGKVEGPKKLREAAAISSVAWLTRAGSARRDGVVDPHYRPLMSILDNVLSFPVQSSQTRGLPFRPSSHLDRTVMTRNCQYINLETFCTKIIFGISRKTRRPGNPELPHSSSWCRVHAGDKGSKF